MIHLKRAFLPLLTGALIALAAGHAVAQEAQSVPDLVDEQMPHDWYVTQLHAWKKVVEKTPTDADAWLNYFKATRYSGFGDTTMTDEEKSQRQHQAVAEMEKAIPDSWAFHYATWWAGGNELERFPHLQRALELHPDYSILSDDFITYYELNGNAEKVKFFCKKWYETRAMAPSLLEYSYNVLMSLDSNAVIVTCGDNDTYPLWVLQNAKGIRPDVTVLNASLILNTDYLARVMKEKNLHADPKLLDWSRFATTPVESCQAEFFRSLTAGTPNRPIYFALTLDTAYTQLIREDLYTVGLANRYSSRRLDNVAIVERNWKKFHLDYLDLQFYNEAYRFNRQHLPMLNMNYITPAMLLYEHALLAGNDAEAARMQELIVSLGRQGDQEKEVETYLQSVAAEKPAEMNAAAASTAATQRNAQLDRGTRVFPNPTSTTLTVEIPFDTDAQLDFASVDGTIVKSLATHGRSTTVDIADVAPGAYVLRIRANGAEISRNVNVIR